MSTSPPAPALEHYENFPVASWLCPPHLRPPIAAIYTFARTADDIADEGNASADERLATLADYSEALACAAQMAERAQPVTSLTTTASYAARLASEPFTFERWPQVFMPLAAAIRAFELPLPLLAALLSAFVQDVRKTRDAAGYADRAELLDYCARSANPVGRLLLHLYGLDETREPLAFRQSDAICSALQLINFCQDASVDLARGRFYFPAADCTVHGVAAGDLLEVLRAPVKATPVRVLRLVADEVQWARELMRQGAPLAKRLPGRIGWELRLVVQGGLAVLDKIEQMGFATLHRRPTVGRADLPRLLVQALRM